MEPGLLWLLAPEQVWSWKIEGSHHSNYNGYGYDRLRGGGGGGGGIMWLPHIPPTTTTPEIQIWVSGGGGGGGVSIKWEHFPHSFKTESWAQDVDCADIIKIEKARWWFHYLIYTTSRARSASVSTRSQIIKLSKLTEECLDSSLFTRSAKLLPRDRRPVFTLLLPLVTKDVSVPQCTLFPYILIPTPGSYVVWNRYRRMFAGKFQFFNETFGNNHFFIDSYNVHFMT